MPDSQEQPLQPRSSRAATVVAATALSRLREAASRPFEEARAMPPEVYTSRAFLELEKQSIFSCEWQCLGRASALAKPGDYLTADINGQPVVALRTPEGKLRAMSNVCLHRMSVLLEGEAMREPSCAHITHGPIPLKGNCVARRC